MLFKCICYLYPVFLLWYIVQDQKKTNWASTEAQLLNKRMSTIKLKIEIKISASKQEVWTCTANKLKISLTYVKVDRKTYTIPLVSKKTVQQQSSNRSGHKGVWKWLHTWQPRTQKWEYTYLWRHSWSE